MATLITDNRKRRKHLFETRTPKGSIGWRGSDRNIGFSHSRPSSTEDIKRKERMKIKTAELLLRLSLVGGLASVAGAEDRLGPLEPWLARPLVFHRVVDNW